MNFSDMFQKAKELQEQMLDIKSRLKTKHVEGESGGSMVKATMNGDLQLIKLEIANELISSNENKMIEDLVIAAVNNAILKAQELQQSEFEKIKGNLPNIPGLNLGL